MYFGMEDSNQLQTVAEPPLGAVYNGELLLNGVRTISLSIQGNQKAELRGS